METKLVDSNISILVREELRKTEKITKMYNSLILNIGLLGLFIIVLGGILYTRYNDKKNTDVKNKIEKRNKLLEMNYGDSQDELLFYRNFGYFICVVMFYATCVS